MFPELNPGMAELFLLLFLLKQMGKGNIEALKGLEHGVKGGCEQSQED